MLTQDDKKQISDIVVDVIQDVVMPAFETLNNKIDKVANNLTNDINGVKTRVEQIDRKLDIITGKVFTHDSQLVIHEKRLKKVEQIASNPS